MQRLAETSTQIPCVTFEKLAQLTAKTPTAILGSPQHGKTTCAKWIVKATCAMENVKIRVFDSSTKWLFNSPCEVAFQVPSPQVTILESNTGVVAYEHNSLITDKILEDLLKHKSIVFDFSEIDSLDFEREIQQRLIHIDKSRLISETKKNRGQILERIVYVYEECQGTLGTNSLRRNSLAWLAKAISVGANYGLSLLVVTRRASEVSTQVFEHTNQKIVTNSNQPNCMRKLRAIFDREYLRIIRKLQLGQFLVLTPQGVSRLETTIYKDKDPQLITLKVEKEQGLLSKAKSAIKKLLGRVKHE